MISYFKYIIAFATLSAMAMDNGFNQTDRMVANCFKQLGALPLETYKSSLQKAYPNGLPSFAYAPAIKGVLNKNGKNVAVEDKLRFLINEMKVNINCFDNKEPHNSLLIHFANKSFGGKHKGFAYLLFFKADLTYKTNIPTSVDVVTHVGVMQQRLLCNQAHQEIWCQKHKINADQLKKNMQHTERLMLQNYDQNFIDQFHKSNRKLLHGEDALREIQKRYANDR